MPSLTPAHPDAPEPAVAPFDLARVPDEAADRVPATERLPPPDANPADVPGALPLPRIVLGCAPFGQGIYAATGTPADAAALPLRIVRAALRAGITAFDTAPHYHPSEIVLGHALAALRDEFPRNSYSIITKVAKYGPRVANHAYDPHVVRKSLDRSLKRFQTDYLDIVCEWRAGGRECPAVASASVKDGARRRHAAPYHSHPRGGWARPHAPHCCSGTLRCCPLRFPGPCLALRPALLNRADTQTSMT